MADKINFELVSPESLLVSQPVDMAVIPGGEGYYGVLAGHAPMITSVGPGVISIYQDERITNRVFVAGGFAEVTADRCTVLAEQAQDVETLNQPEIEKQIRELLADIEASKNDDERDALSAKLAVARAKLEAVTGTVAVG